MLGSILFLGRRALALTTSRTQKRYIQMMSPLSSNYRHLSSSLFGFGREEGKDVFGPFKGRQSHHFCNSFSNCHLAFKRTTAMMTVTKMSSMSTVTTANASDLHFGEDEERIKQLSSNWKDHPLLNETYYIPTLSIPADQVHFLVSDINSPLGKQYLASAIEEWKDIHPKIKLVRDFPTDEEDPERKRKIILLNPHTTALATSLQSNPNNNLQKTFPSLPPETIETLTAISAKPGPILPIQLNYAQLSVSKILSRILPPAALPPPVGYEQIGHVAHFNLKAHHLPYKHLIANVVMNKVDSIKTVVNKVGEVGGPFRTYDMEFIGDDYTQEKTNQDNCSRTFVNVVEHGINLQFDMRKVYWCTRLSGDRLTMFQQEFFPPSSSSASGEKLIIADAFCGVGALLIEALDKHPETQVYANDLNPDAVHYCLENAKLNGISEERIEVECGDAWDFIAGLGMKESLPHHLVMNYPLDAPRFLDALRWWPCGGDGEEEEADEDYYDENYDGGEDYYDIDDELNGKSDEEENLVNTQKKDDVVPTIHVYTFARGDDDTNDNESSQNTQSTQNDSKGGKEEKNEALSLPRNAAQVAVDLVAQGLLPEGGASEMTKYRGDFLNRLGCDIRTREVRDVAPGKVVICVSFKATKKLLRHIQGDFVDV